MRHRKQGRKLGRVASHRQAMLRNMVTSLFKHGRIQTTEAKAKECVIWRIKWYPYLKGEIYMLDVRHWLF